MWMSFISCAPVCIWKLVFCLLTIRIRRSVLRSSRCSTWSRPPRSTWLNLWSLTCSREKRIYLSKYVHMILFHIVRSFVVWAGRTEPLPSHQACHKQQLNRGPRKGLQGKTAPNPFESWINNNGQTSNPSWHGRNGCFQNKWWRCASS